MNPNETPTPEIEEEKRRKVVQITAKSFFDEMVNYGFCEADIINFTTEILDLIIRQGSVKYPPATDRPPSTPRTFAVEYQLDPEGQVLEIRGPRLRMRPLRAEDRPILETWRRRDAYRGTLIERIFDPGVDEIYRIYDRETNAFFVVSHEAGVPLGFITFQRDQADPTRADMQKFLASQQHRGQGFGSEMTYLWLHFGFTKLRLRKVSARTVDSNLVNINLNRKLGFRFEGHLRQDVRLRDGFVNVTVMSVLHDQVEHLFVL